jgi:capsular polysaccharide transport system ATP-binding protein
MIEIRDIVKDYPTSAGSQRVLDGISFTIEKGQKLAVLGANGAGKSTLIKLIGGVEHPTSGVIRRHMSQSWPIAFQGAFHPNLTGRDNARFIARLYDQSFEDILAKTEDFAELGDKLGEPVSTYSNGMRARLAFGLSLAIEFDCYLIDEAIVVGDQRFQRKCFDEIFVKRADRALILAVHYADIVRDYCDRALLLKGGRGKVFDDIDLALDIYDGF